MDFEEEAYVKITGVSGNFHYGYIKKVLERGFHLLISLYDEGESAIGYEIATGAMAKDWDKMLSDSEKLIINGLSNGLTTKAIADELQISPITVRAYIRTLRLKLQLDNRQQLIAFAYGMNKKLRSGQDGASSTISH